MQNTKNRLNRQAFRFAALTFLLMLSTTSLVYGQTTAFTYQGKLTDAGNAATGHY